MPKMYKRSIYDVNYKKLKKMGVKCLLFDLDNTCVPYHEQEALPEVGELFSKLGKMGFKVILFSNSPRSRLVKFRSWNVLYNSSSCKPFSRSFYKILKRYNYLKSEVCIIGDQLFTDVYGGNRVGIITCLVDPISDVDMVFTKFTRFLEVQKLKRFEAKGLFKRGEYYD